MDPAVDDVAAVVVIDVVSVVVGGVEDDVGVDVVAVGASVYLVVKTMSWLP